ncbi:hypothetical protein CcaverHIS002_0113340 [Cutaneotrichosporon cavernicola]|uniref:F-box domain-containing protein n=1 Tax=Cutaneotrichosporon cavernicola TaxID=279322 RepID=A0AA48IEQ5_9TREE|nr:uncharacterized protein CcaverHIS019_0113210 [Cutaneotrichosporon cavernicola]BEI80805.1 hypothetical protein CcaverHIS002_0113340 [Cutaneotrichosporon cavernicola]BEI88603.1 hypothetical protein CcaverHIS019_0113210 [Cutaneotrichosporon cavernicola]
MIKLDAILDQDPKIVPDKEGDQDTMLDAAVFEHLIRLIFAYAPHKSLIRLRAVSRKFRLMADKRLVADRIIITTLDPYSNSHGVSAEPDALDPYSRLSAPVIVVSPQGRIPAFAGMGQGKVFDPTAHDMSLTRIIDLVGTRTLRPEPRRITCQRFETPLPDACDILAAPSLDLERLTVRFMHNRTCDRETYPPSEGEHRSVAGTPGATVLFSPLPHLFSSLWQAPSLLEWTGGEVELRRAVVNISIHPDDAVPTYVSMMPVDAGEVIWVFHRADKPIADLGEFDVRPQLAPPSEGRIHMLSLLAFNIIMPVSEGDYATIAGLEAFAGWPGWEVGTGEEEWEGIVKKFREMCGGAIRYHRGQLVDVEEALSRITFMTLAELREQIGPERAGIETMVSGSLDESMGFVGRGSEGEHTS